MSQPDAPDPPAPVTPRKPRGFAAMKDKERLRAIASKGGKAAHTMGTAHQWSSDQAREAGRRGGTAPHVRRGRGPKRPDGKVADTPAAREMLPEVE